MARAHSSRRQCYLPGEIWLGHSSSILDAEDQRAYWYWKWVGTGSSTGDAVELIAPGDSIHSTELDNDYDRKLGAFMAYPRVAGVAGLVWAVDSNLTGAEVRSILQDTAEKLEGLAEWG